MSAERGDSNNPVGILTFPRSVSYGAVLQMYALYHTVESLGYNAEIINYFNEYMAKERHLLSKQGQSPAKAAARRIIRRTVHLRMYKGFKTFEKRMKHFPDKPLRTSSALRGLSNRYGYVICGSDQVWNPDITGSDAGFFLDFCGEDTRRISYAPSFGTTSFTKEFDEIIAKELRKFSALSVREKQGQEKVRELTGRIPELVLDPTFLLSADDWSKLASPMNVCSPYILYYPVIRNDKTKRFCQSLSEKKGLDILMIGGSFISANKRHDHGMRHIHDIDPRQWLYLFLNAEYIVTDSFHGLAFSVIFRKKVFPALVSNTNSRLEHLISMLGLEGQVIRDGGTISDPDYTIADRLLPKMQEHSVEFLKKALNTDVI